MTNVKIEDFEDILQPNDMMWRLINNLSQFNTRPEQVLDIFNRLNKLQKHKIFGSFYRVFTKIIEYYKTHQTFPDMSWLDTNFSDGLVVHLQDAPFTAEIYIDLVKKLEEAILINNIEDFQDKTSRTHDDWLKLTKDISEFTRENNDKPMLTKEDIIGLQDKYQEEIQTAGVVRTGIPALDDAVGIMGYRSLSVIAGASGSGKTTLALSIAYNAAVNQGLCVDYVSFEVPKESIWQNLVSRHSDILGVPVKACTFKEGIATEQELQTFKDVATDLFKKFNESGGRIDVIDQTDSHGGTFEGFKSLLEAHARKRSNGARKADLIIVDNVDNLQILKGDRGMDETTKVNNFIIRLDEFCKQYYDNEGTNILLLTQVNRTGIKKLAQDDGAEDSNGKSKISIDVTCIQKFNAIYEKATCVMVIYANQAMRAANEAQVYLLKLRNRPLPTGGIVLKAHYAYSSIGEGDVLQPTLENTKKQVEEINETSAITDIPEGFFDESDLEDMI